MKLKSISKPRRPLRAWALAGAVCVLAFTGTTSAQIDPSSSLTNWVALSYGGAGPTSDPSADSRTGIVEAEIVGTSSRPAFLARFYDGGTPSLTDGQLGFRFRLAADTGSAGFGQAAFVGIDANLDGALDLFVAINNNGANSANIWRVGSGANNSPSTTTITGSALFSYTETPANYNWIVADTTSDPGQSFFDLDGGGQADRFLSFVIPFGDLVSAMNTVGITNVDQTTQLRFVAATGNQDKSLNQDIYGVDGGTSATNTWFSLSAISDLYTVADFVPVPEPGTISLMAVAAMATGLAAYRRRRRA